MSDEKYMRAALEQARRAAAAGEVPIGAVLVDLKGEVLASEYNRPISTSDPTAHAEILVLRRAGEIIENYRLPGCAIYVTVEPCLMCMGALVNARVTRLVYGAPEPKFGCVTSLMDFGALKVNHRLEIVPGVLGDECSGLLVDFFKKRRDRG
jgi:tRNA(adenine34) deaminase